MVALQHKKKEKSLHAARNLVVPRSSVFTEGGGMEGGGIDGEVWNLRRRKKELGTSKELETETRRLKS